MNYDSGTAVYWKAFIQAAAFWLLAGTICFVTGYLMGAGITRAYAFARLYLAIR